MSIRFNTRNTVGLWKQNVLQARSIHQKKLFKVATYNICDLLFSYILEILFMIAKEEVRQQLRGSAAWCSTAMVSQN